MSETDMCWDREKIIEEGNVISKKGVRDLTTTRGVVGISCNCKESDTLGKYRGIKVRLQDKTYYILHSTIIGVVDDSGDVWVNSGGWKTRVTKDRMNKVLPIGYKLVQRDYDWYIRHDNELMEFEDKMLVEHDEKQEK